MTNNQDLRVIKTKNALCCAFIDLMSQKSFDNITISELCSKAMVRRATFYKHFNDKYDFFKFFILEMHQQIEEECKNELEIDYIKDNQIFNVYHYFLLMGNKILIFLEQNEVMVQNFLESNLLSRLMDILGEDFLKKLNNKKFPFTNISNDYTEIVASFYIGGMLQTVRWWINNKDKITKEELLNKLHKMMNSFVMQNY